MPLQLRSQLTFLFFLTLCRLAFCEELQFELDHTLALPDIQINDQPAHIHTQGLYVNDEHIFVTGRLEQSRKRPLFLRFDRKDPRTFDFIDLAAGNQAIEDQQLDHPGGFDFDGEDFWIPIARSNPKGPSVIVRVSRDLAAPFRSWQRKNAFRVDDHIGAVAYETVSRRLYGANWDTKQVYVWQRDGSLMTVIDRGEWLRDDPNWELAVQDWKGVPDDCLGASGALIAGGIDKSRQRSPSMSPAVVEVYIPVRQAQLTQIRLPSVDGFAGPVTNEGMSLCDPWLVLLPSDIGQDARLYFFKRVTSPQSHRGHGGARP